MTLALHYALRSDVGLLREGNEDSAYAGPHLLAIAGGMPAHAVRDGQEIRPRERGVLVSLAKKSDVRAERIVQCERHLRSSRTVLPIRMGTPTGTGVGRVTFCRSR